MPLSIDQSIDYYRVTFQNDLPAWRRTSAARSTVAKCVKAWSIPSISDSDETKAVGLEAPGRLRVRYSRTPAPPPDRDPQIYHRGLLPTPDIISPPPISCSVIRNPGAPTAHLFMSWHFFPPVSRLFFLPLSLAHSSSGLDAPPLGTTRFLRPKRVGRIRPNSLFAMFKKNYADANTRRTITHIFKLWCRWEIKSKV